MKKLIIVGVFLLVGFVGSLKWFFWEPDDIEKDSFIFHIKLPGEVKRFPVWNPGSQALYSLQIADGEKPSIIVMKYSSNDSLSTVTKKASDTGFTCELETDNSVVCNKKIKIGLNQKINVESKNSTTLIEAVFIGY